MVDQPSQLVWFGGELGVRVIVLGCLGNCVFFFIDPFAQLAPQCAKANTSYTS